MAAAVATVDSTAAFRNNRRRVTPAGVPARMGAAVLDVAPIHALVAFGAWRTGLWAHLAHPAAGDVVAWKAQAAAAALAVGAVVLLGILAASTRSAGRTLFGTRVVGARSYHRIGIARSVLRVVLRDGQIVAALALTAPWIQAHRPTDDLRAATLTAAWVMSCYVAPLAVSALLPRHRTLHDWLTGTTVIEADAFSRRPRTLTEILRPETIRSAKIA
jgi:uncharacterized RDD family membrane protein YckC